MRIVSLVDNLCDPAHPELAAEFGLAVYIESGENRILFDTGARGAFRANAARLGIDLARVTHAVLSHHHSDHAGGLAAFLEANSTAKVFLRKYAGGRPYLHLLVLRKDIGLDEAAIRAHAARMTYVEADTEIAPGVHLLTAIPKTHPLPQGNRFLYVHGPGGVRRDDFGHELVLALRAEGKLIAFTGCSHHGIRNMLDAVTRAFPGTPIEAVFGGFHQIGIPLLNTMAGTRAEVEALGHALGALPVKSYYSGHCTGKKAFGVLKGVLGNRLEYFAAGSDVRLGG